MRVERVRITKAYLDSYWYADKIGQEFYIFDGSHVAGTWASPHYINEGDFEVLDVFDADILEQVTIEIRPTNRNIQDFDNE